MRLGFICRDCNPRPTLDRIAKMGFTTLSIIARRSMVVSVSNCFRRFEYTDFDPAQISKGVPSRCPIKGCSGDDLVELLYGKQQSRNGDYKRRIKLWCPKHGIRLHSGTFVYWNGDQLRDEARLRNFIVLPDLVRDIALAKGMKAESHRLGYEMSEDALSWNVFVTLADAGKLREVARFLTGLKLKNEPLLYLWGHRVDVEHNDFGIYPALAEVRERIEYGIHTFVTEPDIMLIAEGEMVICIEAKFAAPNALAYESEEQKGQKPTSREGLLARYLGAKVSDQTNRLVRLDRIDPSFYSQLFRNIVFASEMAGKVPWHVTNLVSSTQLGARSDRRHSFADPTEVVRGYLHSDFQHCFTYCTWEKLHKALIRDDASLIGLDRYLRNKSAHYRRAFDLT